MLTRRRLRSWTAGSVSKRFPSWIFALIALAASAPGRCLPPTGLSLELQPLSGPSSQSGRSPLFERVVIVGASVSAEEVAASPGRLLARHMGTPENRIFVFARGGAKSEEWEDDLDRIADLKPTLIVGLDLFYHDFKFSLFLSESRKQAMRALIGRLQATGAPLVVGNIPALVLLRYGHANRYLESLELEFPNLVLIDVESMYARLVSQGLAVQIDRTERVLRKSDLFVDREHINLLGSAIVARSILQSLQSRFPSATPRDVPDLNLADYAP